MVSLSLLYMADALRTVYTSILQLEICSSWYRCHTQWSLCNSPKVFQYFTDKTILCNKQLNNLSAEARNSDWKQEVLPLKRNTLPVSTAENTDCAVFWFLKLLCFIFPRGKTSRTHLEVYLCCSWFDGQPIVRAHYIS